ncbi:MAG: hypothetical protein WA688_04745 [Thermoplasmata archaeon]
MNAIGAELERVGAREFFAREYLLEDLGWIVAGLLGKPGTRLENATGQNVPTGRARASASTW